MGLTALEDDLQLGEGAPLRSPTPRLSAAEQHRSQPVGNDGGPAFGVSVGRRRSGFRASLVRVMSQLSPKVGLMLRPLLSRSRVCRRRFIESSRRGVDDEAAGAGDGLTMQAVQRVSDRGRSLRTSRGVALGCGHIRRARDHPLRSMSERFSFVPEMPPSVMRMDSRRSQLLRPKVILSGVAHFGPDGLRFARFSPGRNVRNAQEITFHGWREIR